MSFLQEDPELKATLLQWEQEAPEEVKAEIEILRTGNSLAKARACDRLGRMGPEAKGAILALIETLRDTTQMRVKAAERRYLITTPSGGLPIGPSAATCRPISRLKRMLR